MELGVADVELCLAQRGVVEEEASREIVDGLLGLRQELIGEEGDPVAGLAEECGEERIVAPLAFLPDNMHREEVLEDKAREVPAAHHVGELGKQTA